MKVATATISAATITLPLPAYFPTSPIDAGWPSAMCSAFLIRPAPRAWVIRLITSPARPAPSSETKKLGPHWV